MTRAVSPLLGTTLLAGLVVLLAAVVGVTALGMVPEVNPADPVVVSVSASDDGRVEVVHEAGPALDVSELTVRLFVDDEPLEDQPPLPFFSATGFRSGPTGPFNPSADQTWETGERASLVVASENEPSLERGSTLTVRVFRDEVPIVKAETRIE